MVYVRPGQRTPRQQAWIRHYAATGDARVAAEMAGYPRPIVEASRLKRRPDLVEEAMALAQERMAGELLPLAIDTVKDVMLHSRSDTARISAARLALEHTLGRVEAGAAGTELHEMTADELQAVITGLDMMRARLTAVDAEIAPPSGGAAEGIFD